MTHSQAFTVGYATLLTVLKCGDSVLKCGDSVSQTA